MSPTEPKHPRYRQYATAVVFLLILAVLPCWCLGSAACCTSEFFQYAKKCYWSVDYQLRALKQPASIQTRWRTIQNSSAAFLQSPEAPPFLKSAKWYMVSTHGGIQRLLGKSYIIDPEPSHDVVLMNNGCLTWGVQTGKASIDTAHILKSAENLRTFKAFLDQQGIPLLFVVFPHKIHCQDPQLPRGVVDAANPAADLFLAQLDQMGIPYVDTREILANNPQEHYRLFQQYDHHWKQEYAFLAFQHLVPALRKCGIDVPNEILNLEPYCIRTYQHEVPALDGSQVRRVGMFYGTPRTEVSGRSCHIKPEHANDVSVFDSESAEIIAQKVPQGLSAEEETQTSLLLKQMQADCTQGLRHAVHRNHVLNGKKLLLIKDSFAIAMLGVLARAFQQVDVIDLRNFNRSAADQVRLEQPDLVIISYNPDCIAGTNDPLSPQLFEFMSVSTQNTAE